MIEGKYIQIIADHQKFDALFNTSSSGLTEKDGNFTKYIDGNKCGKKKKLFKQFSDEFNFPSYFSYNWDSFDECFNDLEWLGTKKQIILFIKNFDELLKHDDENRKIFISLMLSAVKEWRTGRNYNKSFIEPPIPFTVIIQSDESQTCSENFIEVI